MIKKVYRAIRVDCEQGKEVEIGCVNNNLLAWTYLAEDAATRGISFNDKRFLYFVKEDVVEQYVG